MRSCWVAFRGNVLNLMRRYVDFSQCRSKSRRISANAGANIVGGVFARATDRHLDQHRGERRQYYYCQGRDNADTAVTIATAIGSTKKQSKLREHGDSAGNRRGHCHKKRIVIFDVREFMGNDARELITRKHLKQ